MSRVQWFKLAKTVLGFDMLKTIKNFNVELCTRCNLHCFYCGLRCDRPKEFLDIELLEDLIWELINEGIEVKEFNLSHSAEALLHPEFRRAVQIMYWWKRNTKGIINLDTNLMLLNPALTDFIIEEEMFDTIVCSIDGIDKHTFESLRPPADFDTVRQNFLYLIEQPNRPKVIINNGLEFNMLEKPTSSEFQCMLDNADEVISYVFHDWGGRVDSGPEIIPEDKGKGFCRYAFNSVVLHANGMIGKCCRDLNGDTAYGDFSKHSLRDIYHSRRRKKDLLWMALRKRHRATGCGGCGVS